MRILRVFLPGAFEDAYVYMGWLIALTTDRSLQLFNLEQATERIDAALPRSAPAAQLFFARNDWLGSSQFETLMTSPDLSRSFRLAVENFPDRLDATAYLNQASELPVGLGSAVVLDMRFYGRRLYVAASDGLYDADLDWEDLLFHGKPRRRLDARCLNLNARFGVVNASCGADGLFAGIHEFAEVTGVPELLSLAAQSVRTAWLQHAIVNYSTNVSPSLFKTRRGKDDLARSEDREVVSEIERTPFSLDYLFREVERDYGPVDDSVQFVFNSSNTVFVHTFEGDFLALSLRKNGRDTPDVRFTRTFKGFGTRILSAHVCRPGVVVETDDKVLLFADQEWIRLLESPVLSVRTFPTSKRFQNLIAATTEDGLWLMSATKEF